MWHFFQLIWTSLPASVWVPLSADLNSLQHVQFITKAPEGAWLFRSGTPLSFPRSFLGSPVYEPEAVRSALRRASAGPALDGQVPSGSPALPEDVRMLDINLLTGNLIQEKHLIRAEADFFAAHPEAGEFVHWPLLGVTKAHMSKACADAADMSSDCPADPRQPGDLDESLRLRLAASFQHWDPDNLVNRVEALHKLLQQRSNTAMFFHCDCGCDRTGELFAAFALTHLNWTFHEVMHHNTVLNGRTMWYGNQVSAQWYCEWLRHSGKYQHDDCRVCTADMACFDDGFIMDPPARVFEIKVLLCGLSVVVLLGALCKLMPSWRARVAKRSSAHASKSPLLQRLVATPSTCVGDTPVSSPSSWSNSFGEGQFR
eukprot:TRINITY_DN59981_c0_g1_i1.p1 TRINITY_DN59981_c0_g1~~TRINITY_DN59981_c0_g1_i1.p1  ORF type:complete len:383 (+),score=58.49 TRINITY_DN59981_c0_g1_i1:34-1149(+)